MTLSTKVDGAVKEENAMEMNDGDE